MLDIFQWTNIWNVEWLYIILLALVNVLRVKLHCLISFTLKCFNSQISVVSESVFFFFSCFFRNLFSGDTISHFTLLPDSLKQLLWYIWLMEFCYLHASWFAVTAWLLCATLLARKVLNWFLHKYRIHSNLCQSK